LQELHLKRIVQQKKNINVFFHSSLLTLWCQAVFDRIQKDSSSKFFIAGGKILKMKETQLSVFSIAVDISTQAVSCSSLISYYAGYKVPFSDQYW